VYCTAINFDFISYTATYCYILQLEINVRLICVIKFYLLTYFLTYLNPNHLLTVIVPSTPVGCAVCTARLRVCRPYDGVFHISFLDDFIALYVVPL